MGGNNKSRKKYYIPDYETGQDYEVSKESYEDYLRLLEYFRPSIEGLVGRIYFVGNSEGGDSDCLKELFMKASFNILP